MPASTTSSAIAAAGCHLARADLHHHRQAPPGHRLPSRLIWNRGGCGRRYHLHRRPPQPPIPPPPSSHCRLHRRPPRPPIPPPPSHLRTPLLPSGRCRVASGGKEEVERNEEEEKERRREKN
ncbi:Os02g0269625 [Oryza sativa Japonica Group]|uniref:Os02g0269625 protein n=2 Tax=Oryza sativa subsp. japonica TaxID=39947 RepID=Q6ERT2_ORYSJ|nr:hypothetical protein [Oryza sativa Japonica Group]BAS78046.1 Os02g0269625 [Oryza sativa Japonica Group]